MRCASCHKAANRQAKLFKQGKITAMNSYENIHALHKIVLSRKDSIMKAAKVLGVKVIVK